MTTHDASVRRFADNPIFEKSDGSTKKSQTTLTVGLVYAFGGKL